MLTRMLLILSFLISFSTAQNVSASKINQTVADGIAAVEDADGDGIPDEIDNCPTVYNPGQEDGDNSGVGDACDCCEMKGDFDHNGRVDVADVVAWTNWAFQGSPVGPECVEGEEGSYYYPECDMDGNGRVDVADMLYWVRWSFHFMPRSSLGT